MAKGHDIVITKIIVVTTQVNLKNFLTKQILK